MATQGDAFVKGGCGCLLAFLVIGILSVVLGGSVSINTGGACLLFFIGGLIGLTVLWIYNRGARDSRRGTTMTGTSSRVTPPDSPDFGHLDGDSTGAAGGEFDDWGNPE